MGLHPSAFPPPPSPKRPFSVTLLTGVVLIFTTLNFLRVFTAIREWRFLAEPLLGVPVMYVAISGMIWTAAGISLAAGLFFGRRWSYRLAQIGVVLYALYYWSDRLLVAESHALAVRWPFTLGLTAVLILFSFWVLTRPKTRAFLGTSSKENDPKNKEI